VHVKFNVIWDHIKLTWVLKFCYIALKKVEYTYVYTAAEGQVTCGGTVGTVTVLRAGRPTRCVLCMRQDKTSSGAHTTSSLKGSGG
jgi:hypothetical protein